MALVRAIVYLAPQVRGPGASETVDQVLSAAESVAANIAEGYGRGPGRDLARFLRMAAASAAETESHLRVAEVCGRLPAGDVAPVVAQCREVRALVNGLRKAVKAKSAD